jgi:hypothetical protein
MSLREMATVVIGLGLGGLVLTLITSVRRVAWGHLVVALVFFAVFFVGCGALVYADKGVLRLVLVPIFLWLWLFLFYILALQCLSGRRLFSVPNWGETEASYGNQGVSPAFLLTLRWIRRTLTWSVVALAVVAVARGLLGYGWVTEVSP